MGRGVCRTVVRSPEGSQTTHKRKEALEGGQGGGVRTKEAAPGG